MDRHFKCGCGGTAWITREDGIATIQCDKCQLIAAAETMTLAKAEWRVLERERDRAPETRPSGKPKV